MPGTTTRLALPYPVPDDTVDVPRDVKALAERVDVVATPPLVTALPGSPANGDEVYYQNAAMATDGAIWHLRYRATGGAYKWEYVGGAALRDDLAPPSEQARIAVVDFTNYGLGPLLTAPLAGEYEIYLHARIWSTTANQFGMAGPSFGAVGAIEDDSIMHVSSPESVTGEASRTMRRTVAAAGTVLRMQYKSSLHGSEAGFDQLEMAITPVRVA